MLKFQFECSDEERIRADFENMMLRDTPCGKGIWGNDLLRSGIHFKECGDKIKGFYIVGSESEGTRGIALPLIRLTPTLFYAIMISSEVVFK